MDTPEVNQALLQKIRHLESWVEYWRALATHQVAHGQRLMPDILAFHQKFGLLYGGPTRALPVELATFRQRFMQEELDEYCEADAHGDKAKMLDALVDLVYVALGTAHLHGFNFDEAWRRVHLANMAKVRVERPEDSKRGSGFDVVKPPGWTPPDLSDLVK